MSEETVKIAQKIVFGLVKGFLGTCVTLAALYATDNLEVLPTYSNYAVPIAIVIVLVGIYGRKRKWFSSYRKQVFVVDSWLLGAIALLILGVGAEKQLNVFNNSGLSSYNIAVALWLYLAIWLPTPLFMLADWLKHAEERIQRVANRRRGSSVFNVPQAKLLHPRRKWQLVKELLLEAFCDSSRH